MHRERWQFIRVPRIVDTYYHAKYNMLTTLHNAAPRSSRFFPVRPFGESRFRAQKILLPPFGRCDAIRRRRAEHDIAQFPYPVAPGNENRLAVRYFLRAGSILMNVPKIISGAAILSDFGKGGGCYVHGMGELYLEERNNWERVQPYTVNVLMHN